MVALLFLVGSTLLLAVLQNLDRILKATLQFVFKLFVIEVNLILLLIERVSELAIYDALGRPVSLEDLCAHVAPII